ncbi:MAG: tRNA pseudouridine(13) synthase TruD, partial [bacterium]
MEERHDFKFGDRGKYLLFKLEKTGLDTLAVLKISAKHLNVPRKVIGYSGLKDRYSHSCQYFSVPANMISMPIEAENLDMAGNNMQLNYIGQLEEPLKLGSHNSNYFKLTIRRMNADTLDLLKSRLPALQEGAPIPNYFDSQKFGYLLGPQGFFAGKYLKSEYEDALKLVIARKNRKERASSKAVHSFIQANWKDWKRCSEFLSEHPFENYLKLTKYLESRPEDYKGAIKLFTPDSLKLKITSLQAYLWNEYLKMKMEQLFGATDLTEVKYHVGKLCFIKELQKASEKLSEPKSLKTLPMPSPEIGEEHKTVYNELIKRDFGIDSIDDFDKFNELNYRTNAHERNLFFTPTGLKIEDEGKDEDIL